MTIYDDASSCAPVQLERGSRAIWSNSDATPRKVQCTWMKSTSSCSLRGESGPSRVLYVAACQYTLDVMVSQFHGY